MRVAALIVTLALAVLAGPLCSQSQQPARVWRVGIFHVGLDHVPPSLAALRDGLKALGYEEGKNIRLDWRNLSDEAAARVTAQEFVREQVDLIVAFENQTARAAKAATSEIPVVFLHVTDPVAEGLVKSLPHPGGNLTGLVSYLDVTAKQIQLFTELVPRLHRLLILTDPQDPVASPMLAEVHRAARMLKVQLMERGATTQADLERVFTSITRNDVDGIFVASPNLHIKYSSLLVRLASKRRLPLETHRKEWVERGALFSYGPNIAAVGRDAARYVDRLLKGAKPADLPVEEASQVEFAINLKTATALGLTIPQSVLLRADEVIK